jgi:hypothetical protein
LTGGDHRPTDRPPEGARAVWRRGADLVFRLASGLPALGLRHRVGNSPFRQLKRQCIAVHRRIAPHSIAFADSLRPDAIMRQRLILGIRRIRYFARGATPGVAR